MKPMKYSPGRRRAFLPRVFAALWCLALPALPFGLYLSNNQIVPSAAPQNLSFVLSNIVSNTFAGVNWIRLVKPAGFDWNAGPIHTNIQVRSYYDGATLTDLVPAAWDGAWAFPDTGAMALVTNTNELWVALGSAISNNAVAARQHIWLSVNLAISNEFTNESFAASADCVQFESMPAGKKNGYATTGPQRAAVNAPVSRTLSPSEAQASIIPNLINQGASPYTFTFYLQNKTNLNLQDITRVAIRIPPTFTNVAGLSNFDSILLGTNESAFIRMTNSLPGLGASNYLYIDYSSSPIARGGLDIVSFKYYGSPVLATNQVWETRVDGAAISGSSYLAVTNANYPDNRITVGPPGQDYPWDYQIVAALNVAPVALGVSNLVPMTYVDLIADGESSNEMLTNLVVQVLGNAPNAMGEVVLWRDGANSNAAAFATNGLVRVTNAFFSGTASPILFPCAEQSQSRETVAPTRYWFTLRLTNAAAALWSNTLALRVTNVQARGTNNGLIDSLAALGTPGSRLSRVESLHLFADATTVTNTNTVLRIKQGSFDNLALRLALSNDDPDTTNYFSGMVVTNAGDAGSLDLGFIKVFLDNGDGAFSGSADTLLFAGPMGSNRSVLLQTAVPEPLTGATTKIFWVTYDTKYTATVGRTVNLKVLGGGTLWADPFDTADYSAGQSDPRPTVLGSNLLPASNQFATIIPSGAQNFDFNLSSVSYLSMPQAFTTNQWVPVGSFGLTMDSENSNGGDYSNAPVAAQVLRGIEVKLSATNGCSQTRGVGYLFRDANGDGAFQTSDTLLASNTVAGTGFSLTNFALSNTAVHFLQNPDTFFLVFRLTNQIDLAMTNGASFQITNLVASGPDGGVVANAGLLTNQASAEARIDNSEVVVQYISNWLLMPTVPQTSVKNKYLKISLRGKDPDALHAFTWLDVATNSLTTLNVASDCINQVSLENPAGDFLGLGKITNGSLRIALYSPQILQGTNEAVFYLSYNVTILAPVGSNIGFTITNGSFGFGDPTADGFSNSSFVTGATSGPSTPSNAVIVSFNYTPWDFNVIASAGAAPASIGASNLYLMHSFDLRADEESPANEYLTNVAVRLAGLTPALGGEVSLWRADSNVSTFLTNQHRRVTNAFFAPGQTSVNLIFPSGENFLHTASSLPDAFTRFFLALRLTNSGPATWSNTIGLAPTNLGGIYGAAAASFTNLPVLTNAAATLARVDSFRTSLHILSNLSQSVKQGSFNNLAFALVLSNLDVDATNYLSGLIVSNAGNALPSDLGFFRFYKDDGNGIFESTNDTLLGLATQDANGRFLVTLSPALAVAPGATSFWGAYDVDLAAVTNRRVSLMVPGLTNAVSFADGIVDSAFIEYDQRPRLVSAGPYPAVLQSNAIVSFDTKLWDFNLTGVSYAGRPQSFTSNQRVPMGSFSLFRDTDNNPLVLTNIGVAVRSGGTSSQVSGWAYLYQAPFGSNTFGLNYPIVGSNLVAAGAPFSIPAALSNITLDEVNPTTFYLAFELTNALPLAMADRFAFQVTNLLGLGSDGGGGAALFTNTHHLTNLPPSEVRVDSYRVDVLFISNDLDAIYGDYFAPNNGRANAYLRLRLAAEDPDATAILSSLDVFTNGFCNAYSNTITSVKIYSNKRAFETTTGYWNEDDLLANVSFGQNGGVVPFNISTLTLAGSAPRDLWVTYTIGASTTNIGRTIGLEIRPGAFHFTDPWADGWSQAHYPSGMVTGPTPATNAVVMSSFVQPWDVNLPSLASAAPARTVLGVETPVLMIDAYRDVQSGSETLTSLTVAALGASKRFRGELRVRYQTNASTYTQFSNGILLASNQFLADDATTATLALPNPALLPLPSFTRFFVTFTPVEFAVDASVTFQVTNVAASGPNGGALGPESYFAMTNRAVLRLDRLKASVSATNLMGDTLRQGSEQVALKLRLAAEDGDAGLQLQRLVFTETNTGGQDRVLKGRLVAESGEVEGYDEKDASVSGTVTFTGGQALLTLASPLPLNAGGTTLYLLLAADASALAGNTFTVSLSPALQGSDVVPVTVLGVNYEPTMTVEGGTQTRSFAIKRSIEFGNEPAAAANTVIDTCSGAPVRIFIRDAADVPKIRVTVYDLLGYRVRDLPVVDDIVEWHGERGAGRTVPTGMYLIRLEGPAYEKSFRVWVKRCD